MKWISHKSQSYSRINKLQEGIYQELLKADRLIIDDLDKFKALVAERIKIAHAEAPRCKPIEHSWYESGTGVYQDVHLRINGICSFHIYQIKLDEL